jgi:hypothetical protein
MHGAILRVRNRKLIGGASHYTPKPPFARDKIGIFSIFAIILISFSIISLLQIMQVIGNIVKMIYIQGRHDLSEEEAIFLQTFDIGEKFIRGIIERRGLKSIGLYGEGADADEALKLPSTIAKLAELREIIAQYPKGQV